MPLKILLLGHTGKLGTALYDVFSQRHCVIGKNSHDFDACNLHQVSELVTTCKPDYIINTVAFLGIDPCEHSPDQALLINTLFPRHLALLATQHKIPLVHFSTDAVFDDSKGDFYTEADTPSPLNLYGLSKYGGDCFVAAECNRHYIFRIPVLFGDSSKDNQFVEKMLARVHSGQKVLSVSDDITSSPTYSRDVAARVMELIISQAPYGLYHLANEGKASLFEFMNEIKASLNLDVTIEPASFRDFPYVGRKNTYTPLRSIRTESLRNWKIAVSDYARKLKEKE